MSVPSKDPARFVETTIKDETVVMLLDSGDFFSLRDTARAVWQLIDGRRDRAGILAALAQDYEVAADTLAADVDAFLAELRAAGLLAAG